MPSKFDDIAWSKQTNIKHLGILEAEYDTRLKRLEVSFDRHETKALALVRITLTLGSILFGFLLVEGDRLPLPCDIRVALWVVVALLVASGILAGRAMTARAYTAVGMLPSTDRQIAAVAGFLESSSDSDESARYAFARVKSKAKAVEKNTLPTQRKGRCVKWSVRLANAAIPVSFAVWLLLRIW